MSYFAPYIDQSGLNIPTYQDIEDYLVAQAKAIYGSDIFLDNSSQDFQFIAAIAQVIYDTLLSTQLAYNSRGPVTAIGTGLDDVVALNGVTREPATNSTVTLDLTGSAYTVISNGLVSDTNGNVWELPASVSLDSGGAATVTATCQTEGAITALAGQVVIIQTPTLGWTSVTNPQAATVGRDAESDSELRARQAVSVANPSQALTTGILGAVLAVDSVVSAQLYENDTSATVMEINGVGAPYGYPEHSITLVVDGGDGEEIANQIALRKTPGCYTNGTEEYTIVDRFGVPVTIRFYRPVTQVIEVVLNITPLNGYTATVGAAAKQAVVDYLNSLVAGQSVIISELWQAALSADTSAYPVFSLDSVMACRSGGSPDTSNIILEFDEQAITTSDDVSLIVA